MSASTLEYCENNVEMQNNMKENNCEGGGHASVQASDSSTDMKTHYRGESYKCNHC